ncbi:hypothetical protein BU16DRAFT_582138 [Lophium mytilinum]|uniref:Uncharacterized protein n=1 Tax=Lophium mytilinum TaxID=390894 RepID=A0A6A6QWT0_9PEZI|nr:hypothetical protein BU16DRAFT_582138 [Lophium mytilinum]
MGQKSSKSAKSRQSRLHERPPAKPTWDLYDSSSRTKCSDSDTECSFSPTAGDEAPPCERTEEEEELRRHATKIHGIQQGSSEYKDEIWDLAAKHQLWDVEFTHRLAKNLFDTIAARNEAAGHPSNTLRTSQTALHQQRQLATVAQYYHSKTSDPPAFIQAITLTFLGNFFTLHTKSYSREFLEWVKHDRDYYQKEAPARLRGIKSSGWFDWLSEELSNREALVRVVEGVMAGKRVSLRGVGEEKEVYELHLTGGGGGGSGAGAEAVWRRMS